VPCKTTEGSELRILLGDADKVVEVVGGRDVEIARGVGIFDPERQIPCACAQYCLAIEGAGRGVYREHM
jgi:hypothetical protein